MHLTKVFRPNLQINLKNNVYATVGLNNNR